MFAPSYAVVSKTLAAGEPIPLKIVVRTGSAAREARSARETGMLSNVNILDNYFDVTSVSGTKTFAWATDTSIVEMLCEAMKLPEDRQQQR